MALKFQPEPGSVVYCDFKGMMIPEMVKTRPVVVLRKHPRNNKLVTIIPLSTTEPTQLEAYQHLLSENPLPDEPPDKRVWAKCDMVYTLSIDRMERVKVISEGGKREYLTPRLAAEDFAAIRAAVAHALGFTAPGP